MKAYLLIFSLLFSAVSSFSQTKHLPCIPKDGFFEAEFNLTGSNMNGYLAVRQKSNQVLHVAFTSLMGNNLLEMRWKNGRWKRKFAIKKFQNKKLFDMLAEDILLLFGYQQFDKTFEDLGEEWRWRKRILNPKFDEKGRVASVRVRKKRIGLSRTVNYSYENNCMTELRINHQGYPFSITLKPLEQN